MVVSLVDDEIRKSEPFPGTGFQTTVEKLNRQSTTQQIIKNRTNSI